MHKYFYPIQLFGRFAIFLFITIILFSRCLVSLGQPHMDSQFRNIFFSLHLTGYIYINVYSNSV